ncbi:MAG: hypothetical protein SNG45_09045 [Rikenellaceae bacterium]
MIRGKIEIVQRADSSIAINIETIDGDIWVTKHEIAGMFQIFISAVSANLRVIFKSKELYEDDVCRVVNGVTYFNLDAVIALAFRCKGPICRMFRVWLRDQAKRPLTKSQPIIIQIGESSVFS